MTTIKITWPMPSINIVLILYHQIVYHHASRNSSGQPMKISDIILILYHHAAPLTTPKSPRAAAAAAAAARAVGACRSSRVHKCSCWRWLWQRCKFSTVLYIMTFDKQKYARGMTLQKKKFVRACCCWWWVRATMAAKSTSRSFWLRVVLRSKEWYCVVKSGTV